MNSVCYLVMALAAGAADVELSTLAGGAHTGQFRRLTATEVVLSKDGADVEVPLAEVLDMRFAGKEDQTAVSQPVLRVTLNDGTQISCGEIMAEGNRADLEVLRLGRMAVPFSTVSSIRLAGADSKVEAAWVELQQREHKQDLVVVRKQDVLDHYRGVVGGIDAETVRFLLDGEEIPVNRDKAFGVIFARPKQDASQALCRLSLVGGDTIHVRELIGNADGLQAELLSGVRIGVPIEFIAAMDFSGGKILYLSSIEPREVKYTPFFDIVWKFRRDQNLDGGPLRVGGKTYSRGLAIHSRTFLSYRIGGEYRRFQAVMGIDQVVGRMGNVHVVISGDGKPLLETDVRGVDDPVELDIDVVDVRDLEILVDFGGDIDIADHLDLADAKVVK